MREHNEAYYEAQFADRAARSAVPAWAEDLHCDICGRIVGDGSTWRPAHRVLVDPDGRDCRVCEPCFGEAE